MYSSALLFLSVIYSMFIPHLIKYQFKNNLLQHPFQHFFGFVLLFCAPFDVLAISNDVHKRKSIQSTALTVVWTKGIKKKEYALSQNFEYVIFSATSFNGSVECT